MNSEEIEEEFKLSETIIPDELDESDSTEEKSEIKICNDEILLNQKLELWRWGLLLVIIYTGCYLFVKFFPIELATVNSYWDEYFNNCCKIVNNKTRCSVYTDCDIYLRKWINAANLTDRLIDKCCYWYAPYSNWRMNSLPFCKLQCLQ